MSALLVEASIVRRDDALNPGTYRILPVSVPGFQLGITPGKGSSPSLVEVQSPSNNNPIYF
ncbi:hypothetical protein PHLCEN_2v6303 [Hermanssonia centrifuga]|uniref:Uncharacterized protein n=1 Tax=Hermanssonia centrifuga TaxID=98765 RepID=A0A2R6NZU0_9APHY|nr:hypothetical protein PHLCEN_2v6303 [Hermanssonia centrifuga]